MEVFKIKHFTTSHPGVQFPRFHPLSPGECESIQRVLKSRLGMAPDSDGLSLVRKVRDVSTTCAGLNAADTDFNIATVLKSLNVMPEDEILINWYRFDNIDRMALSDLTKHFHDIWYPSSDDIDVSDSTLLWFVSVSHDAGVAYVDLDWA